ncbi:MAG TPA: glycosyltransferase family 39 protein [Patescibacteria group bacterium]|nr:glycosyltransferase family 39 protein [Patescibacteria group bacterium]
MRRNLLYILGILAFSALILISFWNFNTNHYLYFSDGAKFAEVARQLSNNNGYGSYFSFFNKNVVQKEVNTVFPAKGVLPFLPFSILAFYKIFGVNDFAAIATSSFYFLLTLVFVFLLTKKLFKNSLTGLLSTLAIGSNYDLITYSINGASESPFIFEIIAALYFVTLKKKWATVIVFFLILVMYFTRPQAFIYIAGIVLYWLLINFKTKKALFYFGAVTIFGILIDRFILSPFSGKFFLYSIIHRGGNAVSQDSGGSGISNSLRGFVISVPSIGELFKKLFYNFYNFYKLISQIINPYLFMLFTIGIFRWKKEGYQDQFKIASIFMIIVTLFITAITIPLFRYIHPIVPLIYIIAVETLIWIVSQISNSKKFVIVVSSFLIFLFAVEPILGRIFLDSRFERKTHNVGKPAVYVKLSWILKDSTNENNTVITNLDTWGSWYGERRTVWFPLEPKQLINPSTGKIPFDAIYLTSYLIDDENYYMGDSWRLIFMNPNDPKKWTCDGCNEIAKEFTLKAVYKISSDEDYERQTANAILLVKKSN